MSEHPGKPGAALWPRARPSVSASLFPPPAVPRPRMLATLPRPRTARLPWRVGSLDAVPETEIGMWGLLWEPSQGKRLAGAQGHPGFGRATKPFRPHIEQSGRLAALRGRREPEPGCCLQPGASLSVRSHLLPQGHPQGQGTLGSVAPPPSVPARPCTAPPPNSPVRVPTPHTSPTPCLWRRQEGAPGQSSGSEPSPAVTRVLGAPTTLFVHSGAERPPSPTPASSSR